jgi:hypothetical protein
VVVHPIVECAAGLSSGLEAVAGVDPVFMARGDKEAALTALVAARSQLDALVLRVLAAADDVAEHHGLRDVGVWLAHETQVTRAAAARELKLARALSAHEASAGVLGAGALRTDQVREVVAAVEALPAEVDVETRGRAEAALLDLAARHDAKDLRQLGKRILDVVAPRVGESHEAKVLAGEEARADASVDFTMVDDGRGRCHGRFTVPSHVGKMLKRHLLALANPARHDTDELTDAESGEWRPLGQRLGAALVEYVERYPAEHTPQTAGVNATVVVTMTLEQLLGDQATALLDDDTAMSAGQARRIACEAGIIPAVLGGRSEVLDLGRERRLFTRPQRIALGQRDRGCTTRGCGVSASGCHAHHDDPWSRGGRTDLARGRLLCPRHHRLIHDNRYDRRVHADNTITFTRRT